MKVYEGPCFTKEDQKQPLETTNIIKTKPQIGADLRTTIYKYKKRPQNFFLESIEMA